MTVKDILLVSDIDGTLIDSQYRIPERNREAIQRWMAQGGGFAIATGRSWESVEKCLGDLRVNRPCVLANGGLLYDLERHTPVSVQALPQEARAYTRKMMEQFPDAGIEVFTASDVWILRENDITRAHMANEGIHCRFGTMEDVEEPWCKMLLASLEQPAIKAFTESLAPQGVRFVASSDRYWEMLPEDAHKGTGIQRLAQVCGYSLAQVAAIGDYYNDMEMLRTAGITAAPSNAPEEIRRMAGFVAGPCDEGAVADFIEKLEAQFAVLS